MTKVFVVEKPRPNIDISLAKEWGELNFIYTPEDRRCSIFQAVEFGRDILRKLRDAGFKPHKDYICVAGSMVPVCTALLAIGSRYDFFRVLFYSATSNAYVPRDVGRKFWRKDIG